MSSLPKLLGIVNVTPDSFSDGGTAFTIDSALKKAAQLVSDGADIIDIGGESTRPGAPEVPVEEEIRRVAPVIRELRHLFPSLLISVDTRKGKVAAAALEAGAQIVNDVSGLTFDSSLAQVTKEYDGKLIIGHTRGVPEVMRQSSLCKYDDIVTEVTAELKRSAELAVSAGIDDRKLIFDPCLGFSKTAEQDCEILRNLEEFCKLGPVLIGHSRKSFIGKVTEEPDPVRREGGTAAVTLFAMLHGAGYLRVHDVKTARQAMIMWRKLEER